MQHPDIEKEVPSTLELTPDPVPAPPSTASADVPRARRGFAAMDRTLVSEIARKGGKAAHAAGTAHQFTSEEAREAGRKGGLAPHKRLPKQGAEPASQSEK